MPIDPKLVPHNIAADTLLPDAALIAKQDEMLGQAQTQMLKMEAEMAAMSAQLKQAQAALIVANANAAQQAAQRTPPAPGASPRPASSDPSNPDHPHHSYFRWGIFMAIMALAAKTAGPIAGALTNNAAINATLQGGAVVLEAAAEASNAAEQP